MAFSICSKDKHCVRADHRNVYFSTRLTQSLALHLVLQRLVLQPGGERLILLLHSLPLLLGLFALVKFHALLCDVLEAFPIELRQRLDAVLVHGLRQVDHLIALLQQPLHEGRRLRLQRTNGGDDECQGMKFQM